MPHERAQIMQRLEEELVLFAQNMPFEVQAVEAKEMLARVDEGESVGGIEQFYRHHPRFANLMRAFFLTTSLASAGLGASTAEVFAKEPATIQYVLKQSEMPKSKVDIMLPKAQMEVVQGIEGKYWTHAPNVPPMLNAKEKPRVVEVNWTIKEGKRIIAPGEEYQSYWSIEGRVPGPVLRLVQGDVLRLHLTNDKDSAMPHNIDFHSVTGPGGGGEDLLVNPGETKTLDVRMLEPGFYMYHCAPGKENPAMIPMHMANGMWGYVIVQPRETLNQKTSYDINKPVDHEWYIVQSEWYTTGADKEGKSDTDMTRGIERRPSYFVLNGEIGSLLGKNALHAKAGERVRMYYGNAGPNFVSNFHVIGTIFDKVYREGDFLSEAGKSVQTTLIPAGGGSAVEFTFRVPGTYKIVSHDLFNLAQQAGNAPMVGAIVVEGEPQPEIYQPK